MQISVFPSYANGIIDGCVIKIAIDGYLSESSALPCTLL